MVGELGGGVEGLCRSARIGLEFFGWGWGGGFFGGGGGL